MSGNTTKFREITPLTCRSVDYKTIQETQKRASSISRLKEEYSGRKKMEPKEGRAGNAVGIYAR